MLIDERLAEIGREITQQAPAEVGLPGRQRRLLQQFVKSAKVGGFPDHQVIGLALHTGVREVTVPIDARGHRGQFGKFHLVVGLDRVAKLDLGPLYLRELRLQRDDILGLRRRRLVAGQFQHLLHVLAVVGPGLLQLVVVQQVVIAVRHPQTILLEVEHVFGGILGVLVHDRAVGCRHSDLVEMRDHAGDLFFILQRIDLGEFGIQRLDPPRTRARARP
jgi:hypothetical protein